MKPDRWQSIGFWFFLFAVFLHCIMLTQGLVCWLRSPRRFPGRQQLGPPQKKRALYPGQEPQHPKHSPGGSGDVATGRSHVAVGTQPNTNGVSGGLEFSGILVICEVPTQANSNPITLSSLFCGLRKIGRFFLIKRDTFSILFFLYLQEIAPSFFRNKCTKVVGDPPHPAPGHSSAEVWPDPPFPPLSFLSILGSDPD